MDKRELEKSTDPSQEIRLQASIDERLDLTAWASTPPGALLKIYCGEIARLNSAGIHKWSTFFGDLRRRGVQLLFAELSPPVVEHASMLSSFLPLKEIESLYVSYFCGSCSEETRVLYSLSSISPSQLPVAPVPCKFCAGKAEFDDDPSNFFAFLRSQP